MLRYNNFYQTSPVLRYSFFKDRQCEGTICSQQMKLIQLILFSLVPKKCWEQCPFKFSLACIDRCVCVSFGIIWFLRKWKLFEHLHCHFEFMFRKATVLETKNTIMKSKLENISNVIEGDCYILLTPLATKETFIKISFLWDGKFSNGFQKYLMSSLSSFFSETKSSNCQG